MFNTVFVTATATFGVRPKLIGVSLGGEGDLNVKVQNFEQLGPIAHTYTHFPNGEKLTVRHGQQIPRVRGRKFGVTFNPDDFRIFGGENEIAMDVKNIS